MSRTDAWLRRMISQNLVRVLGETGRYREAFRRGEDALRMAEELGHPAPIGWALVQLGRAYCGRGDVGKAIDLSARSLALARERDVHNLLQAALASLGAAYTLVGRTGEAVASSGGGSRGRRVDEQPRSFHAGRPWPCLPGGRARGGCLQARTRSPGGGPPAEPPAMSRRMPFTSSVTSPPAARCPHRGRRTTLPPCPRRRRRARYYVRWPLTATSASASSIDAQASANRPAST